MLFSPGIPDFSSLFKQAKLFLICHHVFLPWCSSSSIIAYMLCYTVTTAEELGKERVENKPMESSE